MTVAIWTLKAVPVAAQDGVIGHWTLEKARSKSRSTELSEQTIINFTLCRKELTEGAVWFVTVAYGKIKARELIGGNGC